MIFVVSKTGVWDVAAGQISTPELTMRGVQAPQAIKLTCQFFARTLSDNLNDGFEYTLEGNDDLPVASLTPNVGLVQGSDSWQLYTHTVLFEVLSTGAQPEPLDISFNIIIAKQGMSGSGAMMNYTMLAEMVAIQS